MRGAAFRSRCGAGDAVVIRSSRNPVLISGSGIFGKGLCNRFAVAGFDALASDLYAGNAVPYHDTDAAGKEMNSLDFIDATTQTVCGAEMDPVAASPIKS